MFPWFNHQDSLIVIFPVMFANYVKLYMVSSKHRMLDIMSFVSFLSPLTSPTPMLTHQYLSSILVVSWSISLLILTTFSLQVTMMCFVEFILTLAQQFSLKDLEPFSYFLSVKVTQHHHGYFSLNINILEIFQVELTCQIPNQSPQHLLYIQLLKSTLVKPSLIEERIRLLLAVFNISLSLSLISFLH